jgi:MoxR-like ATPase
MTPKNVSLFLKDAREVDDSVLIEGLHGIGKSSIVKQTAEENGMHYELLILSIKEPGDLSDMPTHLTFNIQHLTLLYITNASSKILLKGSTSAADF